MKGEASRVGPVPAKPDLDLPPVPIAPQPIPVAPQPTVDQLIAVLEDLKRRREALDKQEKAVTEQLKARLKDQEDRLTKLGLNSPKPALVPKVEVRDIDIGPAPVIPVAPK